MLLFFVLLLIAFFTYKLLIVLKNKEVPGMNRKLAWFLYVFSVAGIIAAYVVFD